MSEYKPTEYVVDFGDYRSNQFVRLNMALIEQNSAKLHERIVRCRDCYFADEIEGGYRCDRFTCGKEHATPNGYCAWAERKERIEQ